MANHEAQIKELTNALEAIEGISNVKVTVESGNFRVTLTQKSSQSKVAMQHAIALFCLKHNVTINTTVR